MDRFEEQDLLDKRSVVGFLAQHFGTDTAPKLRNLALLISLPLIILSLATLIEGRFFLRSVTMSVPGLGGDCGDGEVLGMSFLGDTMVWPYSFLVPLCLLVTLGAVRRTKRMLDFLCDRLSKKQLPSDYKSAIGKCRDIFAMRNGWGGMLLRWAPWILAGFFWAYNTDTTMLRDDPLYFSDPYASSEVIQLASPGTPNAKTGATQLRRCQSDTDVHLPKWDTDRENAFWSTSLTRIWTLFFYGLTPFLVARLIAVIWGMSYFVHRYRSWIDDSLLLGASSEGKPIMMSGQSGLRRVAETAMSYFYAVICLLLLVTMSFFKEGTAPSWHNYALLGSLLPVALIVFLVPAAQAKAVIGNVKDRFLERVNMQMGAMFLQLDQSTAGREKHAIDRDFYDRLSALRMFKEQVEGWNEWPITSSVIWRILLGVLVPVLVTVLGNLATGELAGGAH